MINNIYYNIVRYFLREKYFKDNFVIEIFFFFFFFLLTDSSSDKNYTYNLKLAIGTNKTWFIT